MSFHVSRREIEKQIQSMLSQGLTGTANDFFAWIRMETLRKFKDEPDIENFVVRNILENFVDSGYAKQNDFNSKEFHIHPDQIRGKNFHLKIVIFCWVKLHINRCNTSEAVSNFFSKTWKLQKIS
ncbi:hypothetical protein LEP1GSC188_0139 [Leptospira weilii serovar Topaz str. LT2116]|uniref:Uncharacterized protein n=1 Tax=Leptospira weilii serovar Topaz str. LT2116 TaxID=1088540 RepID=M3H0F4_9LEPT|nr:hypothetical protein LEP1GSC188_0139 [Leptospira weilii serovar Topaz str. LT2116]